MKTIIIFFSILSIGFLTGCQEKVVYIYPEYPKTKIIPRIKSVPIKVNKDGCIDYKSTPKVFKLIKQLRVKENYSDKALKRLNEFSAEISNKNKNKETK